MRKDQLEKLIQIQKTGVKKTIPKRPKSRNWSPDLGKTTTDRSEWWSEYISEYYDDLEKD